MGCFTTHICATRVEQLKNRIVKNDSPAVHSKFFRQVQVTRAFRLGYGQPCTLAPRTLFRHLGGRIYMTDHDRALFCAHVRRPVRAQPDVLWVTARPRRLEVANSLPRSAVNRIIVACRG